MLQARKVVPLSGCMQRDSATSLEQLWLGDGHRGSAKCVVRWVLSLALQLKHEWLPWQQWEMAYDGRVVRSPRQAKCEWLQWLQLVTQCVTRIVGRGAVQAIAATALVPALLATGNALRGCSADHCSQSMRWQLKMLTRNISCADQVLQGVRGLTCRIA